MRVDPLSKLGFKEISAKERSEGEQNFDTVAQPRSRRAQTSKGIPKKNRHHPLYPLSLNKAPPISKPSAHPIHKGKAAARSLPVHNRTLFPPRLQLHSAQPQAAALEPWPAPREPAHPQPLPPRPPTSAAQPLAPTAPQPLRPSRLQLRTGPADQRPPDCRPPLASPTPLPPSSPHASPASCPAHCPAHSPSQARPRGGLAGIGGHLSAESFQGGAGVVGGAGNGIRIGPGVVGGA